MPDAFDNILPSAITAAALRNGNEWVLPLTQVKEAIKLAGEHLIAVLGVEVFHVEENGLRVWNDTGYAFDLLGDGLAYIQHNNGAAFQFIEKTNSATGTGTYALPVRKGSLRISTGRSE
jgi:hypothetical protein